MEIKADEEVENARQDKCVKKLTRAEEKIRREERRVAREVRRKRKMTGGTPEVRSDKDIQKISQRYPQD